MSDASAAKRPTFVQWAEYSALRVIATLLRPFGWRTASRVGAMIGGLGWCPFRIRADRVERYIRACFPEFGEAKVREVARESYRGLGRVAIESIVLSRATKQDVLESIATSFLFPAHFGKNLDALYDCMTDLVHKSGQQPGFVVVLEQLPDNARFDREAREQLLDVFRDAADFWAERRIPFRCFYSFQ